jgi:PhnB protein
MQLVPYLIFDGNCREAFAFYNELLGGQIVAMISHEDMGADQWPDWGDKIMHARLIIGDQVLMGSDSPPDYYAQPQGMHVSLLVDSVDDADRVFNALADGGTIQMPMSEQPWATRFGMVVDRFGTQWMVTYEEQ